MLDFLCLLKVPIARESAMGINIKKIGKNKWELHIRLRKKGCKERRKQITFNGSKAKAEDLFIQNRDEMRHGAKAVVHQKFECLWEVLELYGAKNPPLPKCKSMFDRLVSDLGDVALCTLADRLETYLKILQTTPVSGRQKPLSNASLNRFMQMLLAALNFAVKLDMIERNPISRLRFPKYREVARDRVLSEEEKARLQSVIAKEAPHLTQIVDFALQVPCRKTELIGMGRNDLDLINSAIRVHNGTTKNDQGLWKPIPPNMVSYFRSIPVGCPYLFYRVEKGVFLPLGDFKKAWRRCLDLAGISDFRFHDTRHISASALLDNGTPEQVVMQVAGWKSNMLKTYYHKDGKQALGLVRFNQGGGDLVDTPEVERVKIC